MKTIHIDFTDSSVGTLGRAGEHNNTEIIFALSPELARCDFLTAEIGTAAGEKIPIEGTNNEENDTFSILLTKQFTVEGAISLQLVGYVTESDTAEPQIIAKSPVVSGIITPGINGVEAAADSNPSLLERIWTKMKSIHTHINLSILDNLTEKMIELLTDGATVGSIKKEVNDDGVTVLRLKLLKQDPNTDDPLFLDLPIFGAQDKYIEDEDGGCVGLELDTGLTEYRPMPQINKTPGTNGVTEIYPDNLYMFGEVDKLHIVLKSGSNGFVNSFYFSFVAHDMTMFTLPDEVKWGNDNEIVVEGGKQYEVSIVNNVALWTSAAVEEVTAE